jgi:cyanate lyase
MNRTQATEWLLEAKRRKRLSFEAIGARLGRDKVWVAAALMGQATMSAAEAAVVVEMLEVEPEVGEALQEIPVRGAVSASGPVDPLIYRFQEIVQVYGTAIKAVVNEMFGDGIVSAIDFQMDIQRREDPKGDRVVITMNGKFLPYKKW